MAKELMEIGGFITEGAEIVNHDASLSGNGTVDSPLGLNETVLFENWENPIRGTTATGSLSQPLTAFNEFAVTWTPYANRGEMRWEPQVQRFPSYPASNSASYYTLFAPWLVENDGGTYLFMEILSANDTNFCIKEGRFYQYTTTVTGKTTDMSNSKVYKIVGINRKAQ